jgi:hypothetical protein
MLKLKDFQCLSCERVFEDLSDGEKAQCTCGGEAHQTWIPHPIAVHGCDVFNPHYDEQVGQWFESADHKKKVLKSLGKVQVSGPASPKKDKKTSIPMSLDQAKKFDPSMVSRMPKVS